MKCPHCGSHKSRTIETRGFKRVRVCSKCRNTFTTVECTAVFAGVKTGYIVDTANLPDFEDEIDGVLVPDQVPENKKSGLQQKFTKFHPVEAPSECAQEVAELLQTWWNEARWSKHKSQAAWTETAWKQNVKRVLAMPEPKQLALARAANEYGWQAIKEDYLSESEKRAAAPVTQMPTPRNADMLAALEQWQA